VDIKQNPFSLYDFLGYFTPGALVLYAALLAAGHLSGEHSFTYYTDQYLAFEKGENYIPFILFAYATGHLINFLSSITVERYLVWALGYPSKYLLGLRPPGYFHIKEKKPVRVFFRAITWLTLAPATVGDLVLGKLCGFRDLYARKLDDLLIAILKARILVLVTKHAGIDNPDQFGRPIDHDFFRYAYHYALESAPAHGPKMRNYVALYGFLRALTLITILLFWVSVYHLACVDVPRGIAAGAALLCAAFGYLFFMGFAKFYTRFSLEALMAMAVTLKEAQPGAPADGSRPAGEPRR